MVDANNGRFVEVSPAMAEAFRGPEHLLTPLQREQRGWTKFAEGEELSINGTKFVVHEIGETRMVLKLA